VTRSKCCESQVHFQARATRALSELSSVDGGGGPDVAAPPCTERVQIGAEGGAGASLTTIVCRDPSLLVDTAKLPVGMKNSIVLASFITPDYEIRLR
jgi:hypothetical protein